MYLKSEGICSLNNEKDNIEWEKDSIEQGYQLKSAYVVGIRDRLNSVKSKMELN